MVETCTEHVPSLKIHLLTFAVQSFVGLGRTLKTEPLFTMKKTKYAAQLLVSHLFSFIFVTVHHYLPSGLHKLWQAGCEKLKRKWRENEEWRGNSLSIFPHILFISSLSIHFLYQKSLILSQNVKYATFVANVTKTYQMRYRLENNARIRCEKTPQVVWASLLLHLICTVSDLFRCASIS